VRERGVDPATGRRVERILMGACLAGELRLAACGKSSMVDLYWAGANPGPSIFDGRLKAVIAVSWANLALLTGRTLPPPRPIPVRPAVWWLCRLVPGSYTVDPSPGGGSELFELAPSKRIFLRRPQF
jgi:hypothetical protein